MDYKFVSAYQLNQVMIVDDDESDADYLQMALHKIRPDILVCYVNDPLIVADMITNDHNQLVILDINMPGKNGIKVLQEIRSRSGGTFPPVVMFSTSDDDKDRFNAFENNASAYAVKPSSVAGYLAFARHCIEFWMDAAAPKTKSL